MSRVSIAALLVSSAMMIGTAYAQSGAMTSPPLPAGPAAGVQQAQAMDWSGPLIGAAVTGGIFLAMILLIDDGDDDTATSTTGT
jgi:hypothetical protein